ncbi:hypothetical protein K437DRAFT_181222 [Tilletiaria anomala UBC 951]|uniref:Uncharacterized protein n=1 Tax=Tilletiaria anomala (strain ATCC 24038 / CBS 436.72 / UBC 951) TaxID=1037660 RepID=A0A066VQW4_TILAU|nr:uncharacterized protein K437DRAFT_181222 [Tilletiaria anomala UBC 951]KDN40960.1 hypothetical protein K437DRAFT_181222 [Tilletiaria anomala UBC 951]
MFQIPDAQASVPPVARSSRLSSACAMTSRRDLAECSQSSEQAERRPVRSRWATPPHSYRTCIHNSLFSSANPT